MKTHEMTERTPEHILKALSERIAQEVGLNFPLDRYDDLHRALIRAVENSDSRNIAIFTERFLNDEYEGSYFQGLIKWLTVGETHFFRDEKLFKALEFEILPKLLRSKKENGRELRIWSAGCSTGEEPYSIAIALKMIAPDLDGSRLSLLATDLNPDSLEKASSGKYTHWSFRGTPDYIKDRFFTNDCNGVLRIADEIRNMVTFCRHNLVKDPFPPIEMGPGPLDLIFCRNVLMYFTRDNIENVTSKFAHLLSNEGGMFVAPAEAEQYIGSGLKSVHSKGLTYYTKQRGGHGETRLQSSQNMENMGAARLPMKRPDPSQGSCVIPKPGSKNFVISLAGIVNPVAKAGSIINTKKHSDKSSSATHANEPIREASSQGASVAPALPSYEKMVKMARSLADQGDLEQARQWLEKAIQSDKLDPRKHYLMGAILQEIGLLEEASQSLRQALYLNPDMALAHFSLGSLSKRLGKTKAAKRHFDNALKALNGKDPNEIIVDSEGITTKGLIQMIMNINQKE